MSLLPLQIAKYFATRLERRVHKAMHRMIDIAVEPRVGETAMSVELFLCNLHLIYGRSLLREFDDREAFLRMEDALITRPRMSALQRLIRRFKLPGIFVRFDQPLRDLLWDAIRIARASGRKRAGLREVITALCLDEDLASNLRNKRGIAPVGFLPNLPPMRDDMSHPSP